MPAKTRGEPKGGPAPGLARQLDRAAHHFTKLLGNRQSEPCTAIPPGRRAVGLRERIENMTLLVSRDANPGVGDCERNNRRIHIRFDGLDAKADLALFSELKCVSDQICQNLLQPPGIADEPGRQVHRDRTGHLQTFAVRKVGKSSCRRIYGLAQVERNLLQLDVARFDF